ncbi:thiol reductant ABC exporter subunit CydD [Haloglycomyces albus]|uniref:thiol reductant ABC exporter subunit CydD n=1 Tax=Haloglycomyces albus TaxID=526067 RepID=UPI0004B6A4FA|nr:thiol reductant ABC exporter subunit CydD [Haloglycomyces albus]
MTTTEAPRSRGIDRRLLRYTVGTRRYIVLSALLGVATTACIIAGAWLIATIVAGVFAGNESFGDVSDSLLALALVLIARALVTSVQESAAQASSSRVKRDLRSRVLTSLADNPNDGRNSGETANLLVRGIEALDAYFSRYIPQLVLATLVPLTIVATLAWVDMTSAIVVMVTLPLIPVFGILIGLYTNTKAEKQWKTTALLARRFTDLVAGLPTLKAFGRAERQSRHLEETTATYRKRTMGLLRVAFMSALALELAASLSVAIVAVQIGIRLIEGNLTGVEGLTLALFVLILAPEAYLPLRQVGVHYHASAEGLAAADDLFQTMSPERTPGHETQKTRPVPAAPPNRAPLIHIDRAVFAYPGREPLPELSVTIRGGALTVLTAPSGAGKSTLFAALLGFRSPQSGRITVGQRRLETMDLSQWRGRVAWMPQRPVLIDGTVADNVRLAVAEETSDARVATVLERAQAPEADRLVAATGTGVSAGEAARIALARLFLRTDVVDPDVLLLDEPTAHLDPDTESTVLEALTEYTRGRTTVVASHRPALAALADREVTW